MTTHNAGGRPPIARNAVQAAIEEAGANGVTVDDLAAKVNQPVRRLHAHVHELRALGILPIVSRRIAGKPSRYWASEELMRINAPAPTLTQRIVEWLKANPGGGVADTIAEGIGTRSGMVSSLLWEIQAKGFAVSRAAPLGKAVKRRHWYAVEHAQALPPEAPPKPKAERKYVNLAPAGFASAEADYSRAKVTVCPSGKDHRFTATEVTPMFSALAQGRYLPADTWASRAGFGA